MTADKTLKKFSIIEESPQDGSIILSFEYDYRSRIAGILNELNISFIKTTSKSNFDGFQCDIMDFVNEKDQIPGFIDSIEKSEVLNGESITNFARRKKIEKIVLRIKS